ncbi:hypothetical protein [Desulfofustis limnaeus]|uniref:Uncharacterized protein n=1 Tax=Desulfofustis limnaeus TaxID=2740163 RepID=A0ABN6MB51_9BACT|nr:hypothetical protein [Desulfofustis limnaeus]BDD88712.1 hypothetical protein DPPLL_30770 [Desulfofustis limnaeus]
MRVITPRKVEIKVRRPNGETETVIHPKIDYMTDGLFRQINQAMEKAGRGQMTSYRNIEAVVEMEDSDYQGRCERCGDSLDTRTAYNQKEWSRFGGKKVQVIAHYCDRCHKVLANVGLGEATELEQRASRVQSYEPTTKQD